nr:HD domain-containing protein [Spirochaetales bacterium]
AMGFESGGVDYITKPFSGVELRARINTWLELSSYRENLEHEVEERTQETLLLKQVVIEAMGELAEFRDPETGAHIKRTQHYVRTLAEQLFKNGAFPGELDREGIILLYKSAPLHDIGKVGIPDSILSKPGKLTSDEFLEMQNHTIYGETVIKKLEKRVGASSFLKYARDIICSHHEKYDGSGYPYGLKGDEIPLAGKIMAIADVYDALTTKRVYKEAFPLEKVMAIMNDGCGSHFAPIVFNAFLEVAIDFQAIAAAFEDEELLFS